MNNNNFFGIPFFGVTSLNPTPFKGYELKSKAQIVRTCNERGFYKICLITGNNIIRYANKEIETEGTNLFFINASTTYN
jgi:AraC family transcriptional activator of pobA